MPSRPLRSTPSAPARAGLRALCAHSDTQAALLALLVVVLAKLGALGAVPW